MVKNSYNSNYSIKYKNFINNVSKKKVFLFQVFANLVLQIFIAYIVLMYSHDKNIIKSNMQLLGVAIGMFALIILISIIKQPIIKFILFCIFSGLVGLLLSYRRSRDREDRSEPEQIELEKKAFLTTIGIFVFMVLYSFFLVFMGFKFPPYMGIGLFIVLLLIIIVIFVTSITGVYDKYHKIIAGIIILLFSLFIAYDTVNIMDRDYYGDFITASMDYFLDILNLFTASENLLS
jgi:FtsH-binding integral membrane protein